MDRNSEIIKIDGMEFDSQTGEMISAKGEMLDCSPEFSGVKNGKVYVNNRPTPIDVNKFQSLPASIQERILRFPNSDYSRDVLSEPAGTVLQDTFPNFRDLSYTPDCAAIIMNNTDGQPVRAPFFMN